MAQVNISLELDDLLQLFTQKSGQGLRDVLGAFLNSTLKAESEELLKAQPYERTKERTGKRNGYYERDYQTRLGTLVLKVPRHRGDVPFKTLLFENYSRSESALIASMAEMVVNGVSTRKIANVMETLCGYPISKSAVSDVCADLAKEVDDFKNRPLIDKYPFAIIDATYFKVRDEKSRRVSSKAFLLACGINEQGIKEVLGFGVYPCESTETWSDFLNSLRQRGLTGVQMITSDAHEGIRRAVDKVFPGTAWQRCQFHFQRNICDKAPKKYQVGLSTELRNMFDAKTMEEAVSIRDTIIADYRDCAGEVVRALEEGFESCMTARALSDWLYRKLRTSNHIERLNRELKRRSKVIGVFPNERSLLNLMGSVLIQEHERYQSGRRLFTAETLEKIQSPETQEKFRLAAMEQHNSLLAS